MPTIGWNTWSFENFLSSSIFMRHTLFEYLLVNNQFTAFFNVFIALRISLTMPVTAASDEKIFLN